MKAQLELIRLAEANKHLSKALELLIGNDAKIVSDIIQCNCDKIDSYNNQKIEVLNPTKDELGRIRSSIKKVVCSYYLNSLKIEIEKVKKGIDDYEFNDEFKKHEEEFEECFCPNCEKELQNYHDYWDGKFCLSKEFDKLREELKNACDKTFLPKDVIDARILLSRTNPNAATYNPLQLEINAYLKNKMIECFNEQNEDFIKNRILTFDFKTTNPTP
jgi:hypothetical protein